MMLEKWRHELADEGSERIFLSGPDGQELTMQVGPGVTEPLPDVLQDALGSSRWRQRILMFPIVPGPDGTRVFSGRIYLTGNRTDRYVDFSSTARTDGDGGFARSIEALSADLQH